MQLDEMKVLIENGLPNTQAFVTGGDNGHFTVTIVSDAFSGKKRVQRQQLIYEHLRDQFRQGTIHALTMKTYTTEEWTFMHG